MNMNEPEPLEKLATLTQADKTAFEAAHKRLVLVGFDNINISEQNDISFMQCRTKQKITKLSVTLLMIRMTSLAS